MILQIKIKDNKSSFLLKLLEQLRDSVEEIKILEEPEREYFEITDEKGICYKIPNWTDEEFETMGLSNFFEEEGIVPFEEVFDV